MAFVYWIRKPEHTDILTQGYVGVTSKSVEGRYTEHKYAAEIGTDYTIHRAIRKYGDALVVDILVEGADEYCYEVEAKLRPLYGIGYNCAAGGVVPSLLGMKHSDETRKKISDKVKGENHPLFGKPVPEERKLKMSLAQRGENSKFFGVPRSEKDKAKMREWAANNAHPNEGLTGWRLPKARKEIWSLACEAYAFYTAQGHCGVRKMSKHFGGKDSAFQHLFNKIKSGWNPLQDIEYMSWLSEQKQKGNNESALAT